MSVSVAAVLLNHDARAKEGSGLNLRRNGSQPVVLPEWRRGVSVTPADAPAAYALDAVQGHPLAIKAQLERTDPRVVTAEVRALQAPRSDPPQWLRDLPGPDLLWPPPRVFRDADDYARFLHYSSWYRFWHTWYAVGDNVLGEVQARSVSFGPDGRTGLESFALAGVRLASRGVGVHPVAWRWQYRLSPAEPWIDMETTEHLIYTVLGLPTRPWTQDPSEPGNLSLPWTEVLDVACSWAAGALTRGAAAQRITAALFGQGRTGRFTYGCPLGGREMYANTPFDYFDCTAFLERLRGGGGNGPYINCTDCATIVSTLANALGLDLWQSRMGEYVPPFATNPILAIGSAQWQVPCGWAAGFSYHEVAWAGACTEEDPVCDACLAVDADPFPVSPPFQALLPVFMRFGRIGEGAYRDRLASPLFRAICRPRPEERRRRAIV